MGRLTYEQVSSLAGEVDAWLQRLLVAGHHPHALGWAVQGLFIHPQLLHAAHETCRPGELQREGKGTYYQWKNHQTIQMSV